MTGGKVMIMSSVHSYNDSRIYHKQARSLREAGYQVELHALADFQEREIEGVRIIGLPIPQSKGTRLLGGWRLFLRALRSRADHFHFHDPELLPLGVLLQQMTRRPVIYDAHEDLPKQIGTKPWIPVKWRNSLARVADWVEKGMASRLSAVVTATDPIASNFTSTTKRVVTVKNYPLPFRDSPPVKERNSNCIVYVGGISYLRGYKEMIAMMDYLPPELEAELHLVGPLQHIHPEDRKETELRNKRVTLHGRIPFEEVGAWLARSKVGLVCLHPVENYRESLPIKLFEYMAAGLPVVATNFPLWQQILESSGAGVTVNALDPKEMAGKVEEILRDSSLSDEMAKNGREAHRDVYNWCIEEKKLLGLYRDLTPLSRHKGGSVSQV
ncbi:Glycosyltransferase involved in cell wall bisynthesis [Marininema mesophilum]|uniref:Glycosyltransferase involved in cell wall bisynthesis n=1 Tax=Marininema mesophilum TaxID=1048340 RepID=A0A1H2TG37_9BACL|nr:glycosyltransferase family 4 protein [Marininema mesophilum]SDW42818.1 Glycosyltransferase involved in cell wall bisynthesis [Marininema mesophilum]